MDTALLPRRTPMEFCCRHLWLWIVPALMGLTVFGTTASSRAETTNASGATAITSLPWTISSSGTYYLAADLSISNQNAIVISAANVDLDLNGHLLAETSGPANLSEGIYVTANRVTIHGGRVSGFLHGITITGNACRIENVSIDRATYWGIYSSGANTTIHRCRVASTGGSTGVSDLSGYAILLYNANVRVTDCDVSGVVAGAGGYACGIVYHYDTAGMIVGNRVRGCQLGIFIDGATTKYRDNLCTGDVTTPYTGGTDAGNNQ